MTLAAMASLSVLWTDALLRASWQGGLVIALVWLACRAWPAMPPPARCGLWRLAYLKLLLGLLWLPAVPLPLLQTPPQVLPAVSPGAAIGRRASELVAVQNTVRLRGRKISASAQAESALNSREFTRPARVRNGPDGWGTIFLAALWGVGALAGLGRLAGSWRQAHRLRGGSRPLADAALLNVYAALGHRFGVRRLPPLCVNAEVGSPLLLGVCRPVILLPEFVLTDCASEETRLMLAHELAHLTRRDLLWNWLPLLANRLFFFHPLVWLARREWALAQEIACDALAVQTAGASLTAYGRMVLGIATRPPGPLNPLTASVAAADSGRTLRRRLFALRHIDSASQRHARLAGALLAGLVVGGLLPWRLAARPARTPMMPVPVTSAWRAPLASPHAQKEKTMKNPTRKRLTGASALLALAAGAVAAGSQADPVTPSVPPAATAAPESVPLRTPPQPGRNTPRPVVIKAAPAGTVRHMTPSAAVPAMAVPVVPAGAGRAQTTTPQPSYSLRPAAETPAGKNGENDPVAERDLARVDALYRDGAASASDVEQAQAALAEARAGDAAARHQPAAALRNFQDASARQQRISDLVRRQYQVGAASADDVDAAQARAVQARVRADLYELVTIREQALSRAQAKYQQGAASAQEVDRATAALQQALSRFAAEPPTAASDKSGQARPGVGF